VPGPPHYWGFTITLWHTTLGRTPLYEWSARRRDLYLTTQHSQQTPVGFEPTISAGERPQAYSIDCATTGTGTLLLLLLLLNNSTRIIFILYCASRCLQMHLFVSEAQSCSWSSLYEIRPRVYEKYVSFFFFQNVV
jgi:hypothetical protein